MGPPILAGQISPENSDAVQQVIKEVAGLTFGYLAIVNDTGDDWSCKIGPDVDEKAMEIVSYIATAVGILGMVLVTFTSSLAVLVSTAATYTGGALGIGTTISAEVHKQFEQAGYVTIKPGTQYRWRMTPSLTRRAYCESTTYHKEERKMRHRHLNMRPIASGTSGNTNEHSIQWWLNKWGTEDEVHEIGFFGEIDSEPESLPLGQCPVPSKDGLYVTSSHNYFNPLVFLAQEAYLNDWETCSVSYDCISRCCSGKYSNNVLKCTPLGDNFDWDDNGCILGTAADWERCSASHECASRCCSGKYSNGVPKCTPLGDTYTFDPVSNECRMY